MNKSTLVNWNVLLLIRTAVHIGIYNMKNILTCYIPIQICILGTYLHVWMYDSIYIIYY